MKQVSSLALAVVLASLLPSACRGEEKPPAPPSSAQPAPAQPPSAVQRQQPGPRSTGLPAAQPLGGVVPGGAGGTNGTGGSGYGRPSLAPLVERVRTSVVGVTSRRRVPAGQGELDDLFAASSASPGPRRRAARRSRPAWARASSSTPPAGSSSPTTTWWRTPRRCWCAWPTSGS
jgi:hypothetical protein